MVHSLLSSYSDRLLKNTLLKKKGIQKKLGLKFYRKKQYVQAVSHLEKALTEDKNDPDIYLFLGYASLFTDDFEGARSYFRAGLLIRENHIELLKGLAYIYLKDERIEDAVSLWGEVLEINPRERTVKNAIARLRSAEDTSSFVQSFDLKAYRSATLPFFIKLKPYLLGLSITAGIIIILTIFYVTPLYDRALERFYPEIVALRAVKLPEGQPVTAVKEEALYSFTAKEIEDSFVRIKKYIYRGRTNTAIVTLNRIMLSNASPPVKEKFDILYTFINPPDPLSIDFSPRFFEIMKERAAYRGVYILWTGKIANLEKKNDVFEFDLLVRYEDEDTIEGIAHVSLKGTYYLENRKDVEVFGTCAGVDSTSGKVLVNGILLKNVGH